jgi:hypothetical protein
MGMVEEVYVLLVFWEFAWEAEVGGSDADGRVRGLAIDRLYERILT